MANIQKCKTPWVYNMSAIITCDLYTLILLFEGCKLLFKGLFSYNSGFVYSYYSEAIYIQEQVMMACVK